MDEVTPAKTAAYIKNVMVTYFPKRAPSFELTSMPKITIAPNAQKPRTPRNTAITELVIINHHLIIVSVALALLLCANIASGANIGAVAAVANVIAFSYIGLLLYGTAKENHRMLRWWLIITSSVIAVFLGVLGFCVVGAIVILGIDVSSKDGARLGKYVTITLFIYAALFAGVTSFILALPAYVVYSYICELRTLENLRNGTDIPPPEMHNLASVETGDKMI